MSRRIYRQNAAMLVYAYLITKKDIDELIEDFHTSSVLGDFIGELKVDDELLDALYRIEDRNDIYIRVIDTKLKKGWKYTRLGKMEQAILLLAMAELEQGIQEKAIIVNEAVELAKTYADEDSYKLINGVLDSL